MKSFLTNFKWIMLLAGLLTCTMFLAFFLPQASLMSAFGQGLDGPVANVIVRHWGALIGITGLALSYGAFVENVRRFALVLACASKITFIILVVTSSTSFMEFGAGTGVYADAGMVLLFLIYLLMSRSPQHPNAS